MIHHWNRRSFLDIRLAGYTHLTEIAFKLYAFVYSYSSVQPQEGGLIVVLLRTPLLADPVDTYTKMPRKKHPFKLLHTQYLKNCAKLFLSQLRQISTNFDNFWQKDGKEAQLCEVHLFSNSSNSHHHTTLLNTDVPNCYTINKLYNDLISAQ